MIRRRIRNVPLAPLEAVEVTPARAGMVAI
jgi:hypothetical protein